MDDITALPVPLEAHLLVADGYAVVNSITGEAVACCPSHEDACAHALYLCMDADAFGAYEVRPFRFLED